MSSDAIVIPFRVGDMVCYKDDPEKQRAVCGVRAACLNVACPESLEPRWWVELALDGWIPADAVEFVRRMERLDDDDFVRPAFVEVERAEPKPYKIQWPKETV